MVLAIVFLYEVLAGKDSLSNCLSLMFRYSRDLTGQLVAHMGLCSSSSVCVVCLPWLAKSCRIAHWFLDSLSRPSSK